MTRLGLNLSGWTSPNPDVGVFTPQEVNDGIAGLPADLRWVVATLASQDEVWHFDGTARGAYHAPACTDAKALEWCASSAAELGGKIDPEASDAWEEADAVRQYGGQDLKQQAIQKLKGLAPDLVGGQEVDHTSPSGKQ